MFPTCGDGDDARQTAYLHGSGTLSLCAVPQLTSQVASPGPDRSIGFEGHAVETTRSNRRNAGQSIDLNRRMALCIGSVSQFTYPIGSPGPDRSIRFERETV